MRPKLNEDSSLSFSSLNEEARIVRLFGDIDSESCFFIWEAFEALNNLSDERIILSINSGGGVMHDMFSIVDSINGSVSPIYTVGTGLIASAATVIMAAGEKGHRYLTPNCTVMVHQLSWSVASNLAEMQLVIKEGERLQERYIKAMSKFTGKSIKSLNKYMNGSDYWMDADEAIQKVGIADHILNGSLGNI